MRLKLSTLLLGILLWMFCTHSHSYASILTPSVNINPFAHSSFKLTVQSSLDPTETKKILKLFREDCNKSINFADENLRRLDRLETNLGWSNVHVEKNSPAHGQLIENAADKEGVGQVRDALIAAKASQNLLSAHCSKITQHDRVLCAKYLTQLKMTDTLLEESCNVLHKVCTKEGLSSNYRTSDGSCNHKENTVWGKSFTGYGRLLFPAYHDGIIEPRRSVTKKQLPSARLISVKLVKDIDKKDDSLTLAFMQWSQFVMHDLTHTASSNMLYSSRSVMCCDSNGNSLAPRYIHPFCLPISIPDNDPFYSKYRANCMSYVRSLPAINSDCSFGPVDQMNQVTHYLDGSQVYGSTVTKANKLREFKAGRLRSSKNEQRSFLPTSLKPQEDCQVISDKAECYEAGDIRVNMQPYLTAMHTLWLREHNRIAEILQSMNEHWGDEKLYQETRRIVIAELQHITYSEWIPAFLGQKYVRKLSGPSEFQEDVEPTVSNGFSTAASRFINSLIDKFLSVYDENRNMSRTLRLHEHFNKPEIVEEPGNLDGLVRGLATQPCQRMDLDVVSDVTEKLYSIPGTAGFDALSLDIQRGRDHGLPGYTEYREYCGLQKVTNFNDLRDFIPIEVIKTLSSLYAKPEDIDLLVGGLAENPYRDSLLGPTFTCILAEQFYRTKLGDRFFYTHATQPSSLSSDQLNEIKKVSLASLFCDNADNMQMMQKDVFHKIDNSNQLVDCKSIPRMNLTAWMDHKYTR